MRVSFSRELMMVPTPLFVEVPTQPIILSVPSIFSIVVASVVSGASSISSMQVSILIFIPATTPAVFFSVPTPIPLGLFLGRG